MLKLVNLSNFRSSRLINSVIRQNVLFYCDEKSKPESDEKVAKPENEKSTKTNDNRLNELLHNLATMDEKKLPLKTKVDVKKIGVAGSKKKAKKEAVKSKKVDSDSDSDSDDEKPQNIVEAAKNIAKKMGGNVKETEAELLSKLLQLPDQSDPNKAKGTKNLNDLIIGMKVDKEKDLTQKTKDQKPLTRAQYVRKSVDDKRERMGGERPEYKRRIDHNIRISPAASVNLFGSEPLGIFKKEELVDKEDLLTTWNNLEKREMKLAVTHPPANYFEKMALWTDQGKIWQFPVDNEQGLEDEKQVDFSEHIFLEQHLEDWCPTRGPVRHFMELVCVGLSKNPYLSAQEKRDHIDWYKDYFSQKKDLLAELIADKEAVAIGSKVQKKLDK